MVRAFMNHGAVGGAHVRRGKVECPLFSATFLRLTIKPLVWSAAGFTPLSFFSRLTKKESDVEPSHSKAVASKSKSKNQ